MIAPYDVKLNGLKYLVAPGTYHEGPATAAIRPYRTGGSSPESRNNEDPAWAFFSQSVWRGDSVDDWREGTGGYYRAYGVDLSQDGAIGPAGVFAMTLNDATNPAGYLLIPYSSTQTIAIGRTTGRSWTSTDMVTWTQRNYISGGSRATNAWCFFKGALVVSDSNGDTWTTGDAGLTWTAYAVGGKPSSASAFVLGSYRSKLYIAWGNDLRTWDPDAPGGAKLTALVKLDGTPIAGSVGSGALFILAQGTPSHLYLATGDQLVELLQWPGDFQPDDLAFTDTLYISGGTPDASSGWTGEIWRYNNNGIEQMYDYPQLQGAGIDYRIRSLAADGMVLNFSANKLAGIGTYDGTYDQFLDPILGFGIASKTAAVRSGAGQVIGILPWAGKTAIGIAGEGIFTSSGFTDYQVISSLFGAESKRVTKLWGLFEATHTPLVAGQSFTIRYSIDGGTNWVVLGTKSYAGSYTSPETSQKTFFAFPSQLLSPVIQYRIDTVCNNADLSFLDVSLSFMEATQNPKRRWSFVIGLGGSTLEPMQYRDNSDFERSGPVMKAELDALWNKRFPFEDAFGKTYTVTMPALAVDIDDIVKELNSGDQVTVESVMANYRVTLLEV